MATSKNTSSTRNPSARIAGARKCLDAMRDLEQSAESAEPCDSVTEYYAQRQAAIGRFVAKFGSMTPEQEGAFAVLVEFIGQDLAGSAPNLAQGGWIPLAAMTDAEIKAKAAQADAENAADNARIEQARKVVSLADWRGA